MGIEQLCAGDHVALFYRSRSEQFEYIVPYIQAGLERKERCLYIADNNSVAMVLKELEKAGIDIKSELHKGSLNVVTKQETYLRHGIFEPEKMIADLKNEVIASLNQGFSAFRASGEMTWALDLPSSLARLTEYEAKLHAEFPAEFIGLCQYDETKFSEQVISEMIRIHPKVIARGKLWSNRYYVPPSEMLKVSRPPVSIDELIGS